MSKYEPLRRYLEAAGDQPLTMTFGEVALIVDGLPPSAFRHREWWSNNPKTTAPRNAWLPAGRRISAVDMKAELVSFSSPGIPSVTPAMSKRPTFGGVAITPAPDSVTLAPDQIRSLEAFLTFRGESSRLRQRIAEVERSVRGLTASEALIAASQWGVDQPLLEGARLAKILAAQVDVVLHAAGILHALPHVLEPGEIVESVSLGAGNTGRAHDLETDRRIAEFKFINWAGGAETVRQDTLLIDVFNLATAETSKRRVMYVTGGDIPLHWLARSRRATRECLARNRRIPARFDERYGADAFHYVCDYWAAVENTVEIVDLTPLVPGLAVPPADVENGTEADGTPV
jgi:hypothetical protein